jgi:hypothetical protein
LALQRYHAVAVTGWTETKCLPLAEKRSRERDLERAVELHVVDDVRIAGCEEVLLLQSAGTARSARRVEADVDAAEVRDRVGKVEAVGDDAVDRRGEVEVVRDLGVHRSARRVVARAVNGLPVLELVEDQLPSGEPGAPGQKRGGRRQGSDHLNSRAHFALLRTPASCKPGPSA